MSTYSTKTTRVGALYFCRISLRGTPVVQTRVSHRNEIGPAFRDMFRTLDKMGGDDFTKAARGRKWKEGNASAQVKHEWL